MRLIDADALVEKFAHPPELMYTNVIVDVIRNAPTVGGWISVEDEMPKGQNAVIVYVPPYSDESDEYVGHVSMAYHTDSAHGGYWAGTDGNVYGAIGIIHDPTYWMPLPKPPKKGGL